MKKCRWLAAGLVLVILIAGLAGCGAGATLNDGAVKVNLVNQQEGIAITGTGEVTAVPDVAVLRLGVEVQAATVSEAQEQAQNAMDRVMKALKDNGVRENDIQTQQFNIYKVSRWDNQKEQEIIQGYRVINVVSAKVRDIPSVGTVIDAVAAAGGDYTRIDSIGFTIDDPAPYQQEARQKAVEDAAAKAELLAETAGVTLGKPVYITENTYVPGPIYRQDFAEAAMSGAPAPVETPVSPGEQKVTVNVQITYSILD
jgi:uncharacterized protein